MTETNAPTQTNTPTDFANSRDSIRYCLTFQEALLRFANAQIEPSSNRNGDGPTPAQRAEQSEALLLLCDMIDIHTQDYAEARLTEARNE